MAGLLGQIDRECPQWACFSIYSQTYTRETWQETSSRRIKVFIRNTQRKNTQIRNTRWRKEHIRNTQQKMHKFIQRKTIFRNTNRVKWTSETDIRNGNTQWIKVECAPQSRPGGKKCSCGMSEMFLRQQQLLLWKQHQQTKAKGRFSGLE